MQRYTLPQPDNQLGHEQGNGGNAGRLYPQGTIKTFCNENIVELQQPFFNNRTRTKLPTNCPSSGNMGSIKSAQNNDELSPEGY